MRAAYFRRIAGVLLCGGMLLAGAFSQSPASQWPSWPLPPADTTDGRLFSLDMETDLYFQTVRQHVLTDEGTLSRLDWGNLFPLVAITLQVQPKDWWLMVCGEAGIPWESGVVQDRDFQPGQS